ncbi:hypothetical protein ILUMI_19172, partial [Ignelater luminosus]
MDAGSKYKRRPHPREHANPLAVLSFVYTLPIFFEGSKKDLEVDDIYEALSEHKSSTLGNRLQASWNLELERAKKSNRKPSLLRSLLKTFGAEYMVYGFILAVLDVGIKLTQPICLAQLIAYFAPNPENPTQITETEAYLYAMGVVLCSLAHVTIQHPYMLVVQHIGMKLRIACCSLIYRKALQLSKTALGQTTVGQVVNLLSNDVNRFDISLVFVHHMWVGPVQTMVAMYLMYMEVGISA